MRVITWNVHRANKESPVWRLLLDLQPDIILLQEIGNLPKEITNVYNALTKTAVRKTGEPQNFSTGVLVKGQIIQETELTSEYEWVNKELNGFFDGNIVSLLAKPIGYVTVLSRGVLGMQQPTQNVKIVAICMTCAHKE
ncbi:MAG: hypothetical protein QM398_11885 [Thermoproteota archaeon]|nr:hypothetical protein [Thermoproteota archaeon]